LSYLKNQIDISDEDRLILRLKFCEGLKIKEIIQKLHLEGGVYLRINALLDDLKRACQQDGVIIT
jgi:DNA-directed RNA polymerase specialized sigma subunit